MKKILLSTICVVVLMGGVAIIERIGSSGSAKAQNDPNATEQTQQAQQTQRMKRELNPKQLARVQKREQRNQEYKQYIDSLILSRHFRFNPNSFQQQPAGSSHQIYNPNADFIISGNYIDVSLPYIKGVVPPYRVVMLNCITYDFKNYVAEQTSNGWTITFNSSLYGANNYEFTMKVYASSGMANLSISTPMYNTVSYLGSLSGLY